jgi:hypothetical protein
MGRCLQARHAMQAIDIPTVYSVLLPTLYKCCKSCFLTALVRVSYDVDCTLAPGTPIWVIVHTVLNTTCCSVCQYLRQAILAYCDIILQYIAIYCKSEVLLPTVPGYNRWSFPATPSFCPFSDSISLCAPICPHSL